MSFRFQDGTAIPEFVYVCDLPVPGSHCLAWPLYMSAEDPNSRTLDHVADTDPSL